MGKDDPVHGPREPANFSGLRNIPPINYVAGGLIISVGLFMAWHPMRAPQPSAASVLSSTVSVEAADLAPKSPMPTIAPTTAPTVPPAPSPPADVVNSAAQLAGTGPNTASYTSGPAAAAAQPIPTVPPTVPPWVIARQRRAEEDRAAAEAPLVSDPVKVLASARRDPVADDLWLRRGDVVPLTMYSSLTSGLPGIIVAFVDGDVYDESHRYVVIPDKAKVTGSYGGGSVSVEAGQTHVPATFDSIRFGGHVIALGDDPGIDPTGTSGLGATVDNHTRLSVENFLVLTAAGWLLNHGGSNCTVNCSSGSSTGAAVVTAGQNLFVHPAQSPTLHVSEGASVSIMLAHDVRLPRWAP